MLKKEKKYVRISWVGTTKQSVANEKRFFSEKLKCLLLNEPKKINK